MTRVEKILAFFALFGYALAALFLTRPAPAGMREPYYVPSQMIAVTGEGYLLTQGIEKWITQLQPQTDFKPGMEMVLLQDVKTHAVFAVRRIR